MKLNWIYFNRFSLADGDKSEDGYKSSQAIHRSGRQHESHFRVALKKKKKQETDGKLLQYNKNGKTKKKKKWGRQRDWRRALSFNLLTADRSQPEHIRSLSGNTIIDKGHQLSSEPIPVLDTLVISPFSYSKHAHYLRAHPCRRSEVAGECIMLPLCEFKTSTSLTTDPRLTARTSSVSSAEQPGCCCNLPVFNASMYSSHFL